MKKLKAVLYCRIAHEDAIALDAQKAHLNAYAKAHGLQIVSTISEYGNGLDASRKGLKEISAIAESGTIDCLVIASISRLGRNMSQTIDYLHWLNTQHVEVLCSDGTFPQQQAEELYRLRKAMQAQQMSKTK